MAIIKGVVYFIDTNLNNVLLTDLITTNGDCIIDGEVVRTPTSINFLAFDIFVYNGKDLRGNKDYHLQARLHLLNEVVANITNNERYTVFVKEYIFTNVFLGSEVLLKTPRYYKNDGLIFTPMDEPYPTVKKWSNLLKWKPAELNTIDFYSIKTDENTWNLYVQAPGPEGATRARNTITELFDIKKLCGANEIEYTTSTTTFGDDHIDPTTHKPFQSHTVIEYRFDIILQKFVPLRTRWDKTANPQKHGNFSEVACDIFNNILSPIEPELLFRFQVQQQDIYFEQMRKFHNKVKERLYNKYAHNANFLLELCSGRGGDMHKWIYNGVKNVHGYDISEKNIIECKRRIETSNNQSPHLNNYHFFQGDLNNQLTLDEITKNNPDKFDVVCCHFGIHYFIPTLEKLAKTISSVLLDNGVFVVTFMDAAEVHDLMQNQEIKYKKHNGEIVYYIQQQHDTLRIVLNGNNILGEGSTEYLVDYQELVDVFKKVGLVPVDTQLFKDITCDLRLNVYEKDISNLNRYVVFQKAEVKCHVSSKSTLRNYEYNTDLIDLHINGISAAKVITTHDIIDVINCVEFKYYKNNYPLKTISSFCDIQEVLPDAVFVQDPMTCDLPRRHDLIGKVCFTQYNYTIEKKSADTIETIVKDNWYILLYQNKIVIPKNMCLEQNGEQISMESTMPCLEQNEDTPLLPRSEQISMESQNEDTPLQPRSEQISMESTRPHLDANEKTAEVDSELIRQLRECPKKVTIKELKTILSQLNLKTTGNKDVLVERVLDNVIVKN
ncbi:methyltransferase domain-containing protein [bacterium]|nr:methyltransferase domain-containing protein [bacterium]